MVELEGQLSERNAKLETYERLEGELDDVILQAAESNDFEGFLLLLTFPFCNIFLILFHNCLKKRIAEWLEHWYSKMRITTAQ